MHSFEEFLNEAAQNKALQADLSKEGDLSIGLMNLISLEEHLEFSFSKSNDPKYLEILPSIRTMRKALFTKILTNPQAEEWCISKHLLAASMRLYEVGTKEIDQGNRAQAAELFHMAYELYTLFFGIKLGMVSFKEEKNSKAEKVHASPLSKQLIPENEKKTPLMIDIKEAIQKMVNCCKE